MPPRRVRIAMVGSGLMGRAHAAAYQILSSHLGFSDVEPELALLADASEEIALPAAARLGFKRWTVRWEDAVSDPEIDAVDVVAPNFLHAPVSIAAARAGKHVLCEKPLALDGAEAARMTEAVERAGVVSMVGFNIRQAQAVEETRRLIEAGRLGEIRHFHGWYLQDFAIDPSVPLSWKFRAAQAGSGALGGIGCHIIDTARYLVGEIEEVVALTQTWVGRRPLAGGRAATFGSAGATTESGEVDVDDAATFLARFAGGPIGSFEVSRTHPGHRNDFGFEVTGSRGSAGFTFERLNELAVQLVADDPAVEGFRRVVMGPPHAFGSELWPLAGLGVGFLETVCLEVKEFLSAIGAGRPAVPSFRDGLATQLVIDAVLRSGKTRSWEPVRLTGGVD